MRRKFRAAIAPVAAVLLTTVIQAGVGSTPALAQNAHWGANYFPNVTLTTQDGQKVRFYDDLLKGKIVAIDLIYTSCKYACPLETARLAQVQTALGDRMGRDVFFYSISIDPDHDTPAVLKEYAAKYHAGPGWLFLTGKQADIDLISKKLGLYSQPDPDNKDGHVPELLVGNEKTGQWMRNSALDNPKFLATTIGDWMNSWQTAKAGGTSYKDAQPMKLDVGQYLFDRQCAPCHSIGQGDRIGPDLLGVTAARDRGWLTRFIGDPEKVLGQGDATARALLAKYKYVRMPSIGLHPDDVNAIVKYLEEASAAHAAAGTTGTGTAAPAPKMER